MTKIRKLEKIRRLARISFAIIFSILLASVFILFLVISRIISFQPFSTIVIFNLKDDNITVQDNIVRIFDIFVEDTNVERKYEVKSSSGADIYTKTIPDYLSPSINIFINSDLQYCFFKADVTSFYYDTETLDNVLDMVETFSSQGNSISLKRDESSFKYIYPGRYLQSDIPSTLLGKRLIGIYPILCESLNDSETQREIVLFYRDFSSIEQREYFNSQLDPIKQELI